MKVCSYILITLFLSTAINCGDTYKYDVAAGNEQVTITVDFDADGINADPEKSETLHLMTWASFKDLFEESEDPEAVAAKAAGADKEDGDLCLVPYDTKSKEDPKEWDVKDVDTDGNGNWQLNGQDYVVILDAGTFTNLKIDFPGEDKDKDGDLEFWKANAISETLGNIKGNALIITNGQVTLLVEEEERQSQEQLDSQDNKKVQRQLDNKITANRRKMIV